jgi:hypothetical protein
MTATTATIENIMVRTHDASTLREQYPGWDGFSKARKRDLAAQTPAKECSITRNTTVDGLHESIVDLLDPAQTVSLSASELALGDGTTAPASANTSLNNELIRIPVTDSADRGTSLFTSTFLDTSEANGQTLEEVGLVTDSTGGLLLNHSLIDTIDKNDETTATIDVTLSFQPN